MIYAICNPVAASGRGRIIGEIIEKVLIEKKVMLQSSRGKPAICTLIPSWLSAATGHPWKWLGA